MVISQHVYLIILWILFCFQHSLFASEWWKLKMRRLFGKSFRFYRFYYSVFSMISLGILLYFQFTIHSAALWKITGLLRFMALVTAMAGVIIMMACMRKYIASVSGLKAFSGKKHTASVLQTEGLHSYTRHPLYFGTLIFIWSLFLLVPLWSNLIVCTLISIYTITGIHIEERKLIIEFGDCYKTYSRKVPMLIPRFIVRRTKTRHSFPETV